MRRIPVVVTGGVATGKSTVLDRFRHHGHSVASADAVVSEIWSDENEARLLAQELGVGFPIEKDALRARLSDSLFRQQMATVLHPRVMKRLAASQASVVEIPLLFEACLQSCADTIVVVMFSPETQLHRLKARLGSEDKARALLATQLSNRVRVAFSDWTIDSENGIDQTMRQVDQVVRWMSAGLAEATW
ncbi:MAG: dephospho-CoA kinase [Armatimonadota bacterium]